jgi:hypothetical protein
VLAFLKFIYETWCINNLLNAGFIQNNENEIHVMAPKKSGVFKIYSLFTVPISLNFILNMITEI